METILHKTFYGNTISQWLLAGAIIIAAFVAGKVLNFLFKKIGQKLTAKTATKLDDVILDMVEEPLVFASVISGIWVALSQLQFPERVNAIYSKGFFILIIITLGWMVVRLVDKLIETFIVPLVNKSENDFDDQILPIVRKGIKLVLWIVTIIVALNNAGYDVGALIAGLGIGGLAFALAAQDTVSNLFGGLTIFIDRPFKVNDRVKIAGFDGMIREIGMRSTRLETLEGRIVTIPNRTFTDKPVENVSSEPSRKVVLNLGLTYDTNPDQIDEAIKTLESVISENDQCEEKVLLSFNSFGDFSLGILLIYYIKSGEDILATQTAVNLKILREFNAKKFDFAFPTQTIITQQS